jgi:hypothetical protein
VFVPGGTQIGYGAWGIFRNKKIWGDDADEYRPGLRGGLRVGIFESRSWAWN